LGLSFDTCFCFFLLLVLFHFKMWLQGILTIIFVIIVLASLKYLIKFTISITTNKIVVKKLFVFIPYLTINHNFDKVFFNEKIPILHFQFGKKIVEIENLEGFEGDCILVKSDNKEYEFGDKNDADIIFKFLINGLDELKVQKIKSDIGYAKKTKIIE